MNVVKISAMDIEYLVVIRESVNLFLKTSAIKYSCNIGKLLDIAPQIHGGAKSFFPNSIIIDTFDIDSESGCNFIGDLCSYNKQIPDNYFDYIVCTEVLEHVLQPFNAIIEMQRILKPCGLLFITTPFNFRIHGPLPDCWRFTEHGLRVLLNNFEILELNQVNTVNRDLMPIHYTIVARKPNSSQHINIIESYNGDKL